eukprot:Stramenopile-MAST_4_protein_822
MASNAAAFDGDAVAHLTDIVANFQSFVRELRELREQREGGDAATLDRDVCIWLHTLTQMIEGVQQELLPNQKKRKRESLLDVGDDPKPAADVVIAAAQTKYQGRKAPLCAALEAKDEDAAEALLDGGADPNEVDEDGMNALHRAAEKGCRPPLLQRLVARIHDVNIGDNEGWTALMYAALHNHLDVLISLMNRQGIDLNVQNRNKQTALHLAAANNHPAIVSQLLSDDNINANLKDCINYTPLKWAIVNNHPECVKILQDYGAKEE